MLKVGVGNLVGIPGTHPSMPPLKGLPVDFWWLKNPWDVLLALRIPGIIIRYPEISRLDTLPKTNIAPKNGGFQ